ncbi:hypothetical protein WA026_013397 [Henosepilachna vigintioctopunctata]
MASSIVVTFAWTDQNYQMKQLYRSDSKPYSTSQNSYSSGYVQNGGSAYHSNYGNVRGRHEIVMESIRNRKQVTGYYNPYNIPYVRNNKISKYQYQSTKRSTPNRSKNYHQSNRKQDFGFGNAQRRPRPTQRTTVISQKKLKPLIALM